MKIRLCHKLMSQKEIGSAGTPSAGDVYSYEETGKRRLTLVAKCLSTWRARPYRG